MAEFVVVTTTVDDRSKAEALARRMVEERLAACVQIAPINSIYRWKGAVETTDEFLLLIKTRAALQDRLMRWIEDAHDYELPEIVVTGIRSGSAAYLTWLRDETTGT